MSRIDDERQVCRMELLQAGYAQENPRILQSFLDLASGNTEEASKHYEEVKVWRSTFGAVTVTDVQEQLKSGAYILTLEYPMPSAEACRHPPLILMNGMVRGTKDEMTRQVIYAVERAWATMPPGPPRVRFIVNTRNKSFRIPDCAFFSSVLNIMRYSYPWLICCKVIFVDVPGPVATVLTAMSSFFERVYTERFQLTKSSEWTTCDEDVVAFLRNCPPDRAPRWDADRELHYDIDSYIRDQLQAMAAEAEDTAARAEPSELGAASVPT